MAEGDADPDSGAATDAGESGDSGDAGQDSGDSEGQVDPQEVHDRVWAEAREALNSKDERISDLKSRVQELQNKLKNGEDGRKSPEDRSDVYTEEQVEEIKQTFQSELEQREQAVESANRAHARNRLVEELRNRDVIKPEVFADTLLGRVDADVTEGFDQFEVYTEQGNRMLNDKGDPATVQDLVDSWVENNPEFVRSGTQEGAGYGGAGEGSGSAYPDTKVEFSDAQKREFIAEKGSSAWEDVPYD